MTGIPLKAAQLAEQIRDELSTILFRGGRLVPDTDFTLRRLLRQCDLVQASAAGEASLLKATVLQLTGDIDQVERWVRNARNLGETFAADFAMCQCWSNLGYVSKAASVFADISSVNRGFVNGSMSLGVSCAAYAAICSSSAALIAAGGTVERKDLYMLAQNVVSALERLKVQESQLQQLMDEAGALMRSRSLLWLESHPDVSVGTEGDAPYVAIQYRLKVDPKEAAELNWALAERAAETDLLPSGVTVMFVGEPGNIEASH